MGIHRCLINSLCWWTTIVFFVALDMRQMHSLTLLELLLYSWIACLFIWFGWLHTHRAFSWVQSNQIAVMHHRLLQKSTYVMLGAIPRMLMISRKTAAFMMIIHTGCKHTRIEERGGGGRTAQHRSSEWERREIMETQWKIKSCLRAQISRHP